MLLVLPVSLSDHKTLPSVEKAFEAFPPGSGHKLLVVGSPNVEQHVKQAAQNLCGHFAGNAATYIFDLDCEFGWPTACNTYFQQVAFYLGSSGEDYPWLWYELDTTPTRAGWLDEIENEVHFLTAEAQSAGVYPPRYFGAIEPARLEYQGTLMPNAGKQMAAVGVYPSNMNDVLSLRAISATNIPWYTFLRWYVTARAAELPLIQNNWQTARYHREEDGTIASDSVAKWAWDIHFNDPVGPEVALVHGCKDGSLLDLYLSDLIVNESDLESLPPAPTPAERVGKVLDARQRLVRGAAARGAASRK